MQRSRLGAVSTGLAAALLSGCFDEPTVVEGDAGGSSGTTSPTTSNATELTSDATTASSGVDSTATSATTDTTDMDSSTGADTSVGPEDRCFIAHLGGPDTGMTLASFRIAADGSIAVLDERIYPGAHQPSSRSEALERSTALCNGQLLVANFTSENLLRLAAPVDGTLGDLAQQLDIEELEEVWCDAERNLVFAFGEAGTMAYVSSYRMDPEGSLTVVDQETFDFGYDLSRIRFAPAPEMNKVILNGSPNLDDVNNGFSTLSYDTNGMITFSPLSTIPYTRRATRVRVLPGTTNVVITHITDPTSGQGTALIAVGDQLTFDNNEIIDFDAGDPYDDFGDMFLLSDGNALFSATGDLDSDYYIANVSSFPFQPVTDGMIGTEYGFVDRIHDDVLLHSSVDRLTTITEPVAGEFTELDTAVVSDLIDAPLDPIWFQSGQMVRCTSP